MTMSEKTLLGGYYEGARAQKDTLKPSIFEQFRSTACYPSLRRR